MSIFCGEPFGRWLRHKDSNLIYGLIHWRIRNLMGYGENNGRWDLLGRSGSWGTALKCVFCFGPFLSLYLCFSKLPWSEQLCSIYNVLPAMTFCCATSSKQWDQVTMDWILWNFEPKLSNWITLQQESFPSQQTQDAFLLTSISDLAFKRNLILCM
jgi:hypothetical protein